LVQDSEVDGDEIRRIVTNHLSGDEASHPESLTTPLGKHQN